MFARSLFNSFKKFFFHKKIKCIQKFNYNLSVGSKPNQKIAGVVGWLKSKSKIDYLIRRAINDGMDKVIIFSCIEDPKWYYDNIEPLIKEYPEKIYYSGCLKNRQLLYDSITDLYVVSNTQPSLKIECELTKTNFHAI